MAYANRKQMSSNRTASIIVVVLLHIVLGYALVSGLAYNVLKKANVDLKTFDVSEPPPPPEEKPPPPPENVPETPPPPVAPPSIVRMEAPSAPVITTVPVAPPTPPPVITAPPPPPPPPPPPRVVEPAKARGDLHALFSTDDYPNSALQAQQQGTTAVSISIGPDGRVVGCDITSSSGSSALDSATCNIIRRRARYTPARDSTGAATGGTDSARIRWVLPAD